LALAGTFLVTWISPYYFHRKMVAYLVLLMVLEFIIMHSAVFMGHIIIGRTSRREKAWRVFRLGAFYTAFVVAFAVAFKAWWPLWAFWGLTLNKLLGLWLGQAPRGEEKVLLRRSWAAAGVFYLVFLFVAFVLLPVPELGITKAVIQTQQFPGSGALVDEPQRALAFGLLYFTALGLSTACGHSWIRAGVPPEKAGRGKAGAL